MSRIMITVPDELLIEVDQVARTEHRSRSELFREAVRHYLRQTKIDPTVGPTQAVGIIERLRTQAERRARKAKNTTEIIRSFREQS